MEPFVQSAQLASPLLCAMFVLWVIQALAVLFVTLATMLTTELVILARSSAFSAMPAAME